MLQSLRLRRRRTCRPRRPRHAAPGRARDAASRQAPPAEGGHHHAAHHGRYDLELPYWKPPFASTSASAATWRTRLRPLWEPVHIGGFELDLSPTKHVVMMLLAATLRRSMLVGAGARARAAHARDGRPKGFAAGIEAMVLYLRNEVVLPNVGPHGEDTCRSCSRSSSSSCSQSARPDPVRLDGDGQHLGHGDARDHHVHRGGIAGMRAQGAGYLSTMFYWNKDLPLGDARHHVPVMSAGRNARQAHQAVRAGDPSVREHDGRTHRGAGVHRPDLHVQELADRGAPLLMAIAISVLELFVSFLQAFIFTLLASVFIGQIREAHH